MRRHPSGCVSQCSDCLRALMLRIGYLTLLAARAVVARVGGMRRADKTPGIGMYILMMVASHYPLWALTGAPAA